MKLRFIGLLLVFGFFNQALNAQVQLSDIKTQTPGFSTFIMGFNPQVYHRARIYYKNQDNLDILANLGICLDHGTHKRGVWIESDFSELELERVTNLGIDIEILIEDIGAYYRERNKSSKGESPNQKSNNTCAEGGGIASYETPENFNLGSMAGYFTLEEAYAEIDDMFEMYPDLITAKAPVGDFQTFEGRDIFFVKISDNADMDEDEPEMLMDAIHHAREPAGLSQLIYYMWYLLENYDDNEEVQAIVNNTEIYFIPVLNPDGYNYNVQSEPDGGGMWRKNRRDHGDGTYGVDNNRNYSYQWGTTGVDSETWGETWPGQEGFSEPENQAMKWFCENHEFQIAINNHTYSDVLLYPFGYDFDVITPDHDLYVDMGDVMTSQNTLAPILAWQLYPASGDSDDWMYVETPEKDKIFAFTPEIGSGDQGFWPEESDILPICESMMYHNLVASHMVTDYAKVADTSPFSLESLSGSVDFSIQNLGMNEPSTYMVSIEPITSNIESSGAPITFEDMNFNTFDSGSLEYTLNSSIALGEVIEYYLVVDQGDYTHKIYVNKIYGQLAEVYVENGDDIEAWTGSWSSTPEDFVSESSSITDSPFGNYENQDETDIVLDETFDLTGAYAATLSFYAKWEIEAGFDYAQVLISTDAGANWIPQCGNYTVVGNFFQDTDQPVYDGNQNEWVLETISLDDYIGEEILVRFRLVTDNFVTGDGYYFDDLKVSVGYAEDGVANENNGNPFKVSAYPNPASESIAFNFDPSVSNKVLALSIYNNVGQIVFYDVMTNKSRYELNLADLSPGVYSYQLGDEEVRSFGKFIVLKH